MSASLAAEHQAHRPSVRLSANRHASAVSFASPAVPRRGRDGTQVGHVLDRLVGRPVLAEPDRIVRYTWITGSSISAAEPDGALHVVENEERRPEGPQAVQVEALTMAPMPCSRTP